MTMTFDHDPRHSSLTAVDRAAQGLGLFSIALGVAELAFPGTIGKALGLENKKGVLRSYGVREIVSGIGALQPNPAPALWSRVAGDLLDLATLAQTRSKDDPDRGRNATVAMAAIGAIALVDLLVASASTAQSARRSPARDYSDRSGFPNGVQAARGAMVNYTPRDFRVTPRRAEEPQIGGQPL